MKQKQNHYIYIMLVTFIVVSATHVLAQELPKVFERDPFEPLTKEMLRKLQGEIIETESEGALSIELKGIIWEESSPEAVVEIQRVTRFVKIGDTVGTFFVDSITEKEIVLKGPDKTYILGLGKEIRL